MVDVKHVFDEVTGICMHLCKVCGAQMQIIGRDARSGRAQFSCIRYPDCTSSMTIHGYGGQQLPIPKPRKGVDLHEKRRKTWGMK